MSAPTVTQARDAVYQGIGRNILNLQRLELLLKHLLGRSAVLGDISDWPAAIERRKNKISSQMLGLLAGRLFEELVQRKSTPPSDTPIPGTTRLLGSREAAFAFTVAVSDERHAKWRSCLEKLVTDRNRLVHHFLEDFPPDTLDTLEGCQKAHSLSSSGRISAKKWRISNI